MSESRFSVDDILKEVEMMRSVSSEKPAPPAEPVKTVGLDKNIDFGNLWDAFKRG